MSLQGRQRAGAASTRAGRHLGLRLHVGESPVTRERVRVTRQALVHRAEGVARRRAINAVGPSEAVELYSCSTRSGEPRHSVVIASKTSTDPKRAADDVDRRGRVHSMDQPGTLVQFPDRTRARQRYDRERAAAAQSRQALHGAGEVVRAVDHASLTVAAGELVGPVWTERIGEDHAAAARCGLIAPDSGSISSAGATSRACPLIRQRPTACASWASFSDRFT